MHCGQPIAPTAASPTPPTARPNPTGSQPSAAPRVPTGSPISATTSGAATGIMSPAAFQAAQQATRKKATIATLAAIAVLVLGAIGLKASGVLKLGQGPVRAGDLTVRGAGADAMLKERGGPDTSMLSKGEPLIGMPDDVRDWLEHLRKVEEMKRQLTADQMHDEVGLLGQVNNTDGLMTGAEVRKMADPDNNSTEVPAVTALKDFGEKYKQKWYDLSTFLRSKPAPAECQPIASSYDQGLTQMGATISDFGKILDDVSAKADDDPSGARAAGTAAVDNIGDSHKKYIDKGFSEADQGVADICAKYHVKKAFDIDTNGQASSPFISRG